MERECNNKGTKGDRKAKAERQFSFELKRASEKVYKISKVKGYERLEKQNKTTKKIKGARQHWKQTIPRQGVLDIG